MIIMILEISEENQAVIAQEEETEKIANVLADVSEVSQRLMEKIKRLARHMDEGRMPQSCSLKNH